MLAAMEAGSLSAAAAKLGLTHGAVSRRIQSLEAWLGQPVFDRHGHGVSLTPAGEQLARRVERSLEGIASVAADLRLSGSDRVVRISCLPLVARLWVMPRIVRLYGEPRDAMIALVPEHRVASLEKREADLAIRAGLGGWSGVHSVALFGETLYPLASPAKAAALRGAAVTDLLQESLLHDGDVGQWKRWFQNAGFSYRSRGREIRFDDYDLVLAAAEAGLGIALARSPLSARYEQTAALVRIDGPVVEGPVEHHLVMRLGESRAAVLRVAERIEGEALADNSVTSVPPKGL